MPSWIPLALLGYFFTALASIGDKFLVVSRVKHPGAYAFLVAIFGAFAFVFIPFGVQMLSFGEAIPFLCSGGVFAWSLLFLFRAFSLGEVSIAVPIAGIASAVIAGMVGIVIAIDSGMDFSSGIIALSVLILGAYLISIRARERRNISKENRIFIRLAIASGFLLAISYLILKFGGTSESIGFATAFVWSRLGGVIGAVSFLLVFEYRRDIINMMTSLVRHLHRRPLRTPAHRRGKIPTTIVFLCGKTVGGIGSILLVFASYVGSVSVVQALVGVQFAFVLMAAVFFGRSFPNIFDERLSLRDWGIKGIAFVLIAFGGYLLSREDMFLF